MARVTVEDCVDKVPNRFELVMLAAHRAREIASGAGLTIDRDSLEASGGLALYLGERPHVATALRAGDAHPWRRPQQVSGNDEAVPKADLAR